MNIKTAIKFINKINSEEKKIFQDYFIDDVVRYLEIDIHKNDIELEKLLKEKCGEKYLQLINCKTKSEVKKWLNKITRHIIKYIDSEQLVYDYFS